MESTRILWRDSAAICLGGGKQDVLGKIWSQVFTKQEKGYLEILPYNMCAYTNMYAIVILQHSKCIGLRLRTWMLLDGGVDAPVSRQDAWPCCRWETSHRRDDHSPALCQLSMRMREI